MLTLLQQPPREHSVRVLDDAAPGAGGVTEAPASNTLGDGVWPRAEAWGHLRRFAAFGVAEVEREREVAPCTTAKHSAAAILA